MAKININFNDTKYSINEESLASATTNLQSHLSTTMSGTGSVIKLGGNSYNIDSTKLSNAKSNFVSHLTTIVGGGSISNLIELGGTYTFKEDFSGADIDWDKLRETALEQIGLGYILTFCYVDGKQGVIVYLPAEGTTTRQATLGIMTMDESYVVTYQFQSQDKPQTGWLNSITNEPIEPPTITLPTNESEVYVPLEALSIFFEGTGGSSGGIKVTIGGIEYSVDSTKVEDAIAGLQTVLGDLNSDDGGGDGEPGFPIVWNSMDVVGNPKVNFGEEFGGVCCVKISDYIPTINELNNIKMTVTAMGEAIPLEVLRTYDGFIAVGYSNSDYLYSVAVAGECPDPYIPVVFPEAGLYAPDFASMGIESDCRIELING